ncbi:MAG: phytanoyl-CoA dioxygenase family protein [Pseudomonadales bacterium]|nr:phytanoyl-CoA dioxygenase family protein [Pseudomonadales bacterium]MBO6594631.1 phytanoyl-CoA dioxygenase family protein [Pseudomonadales bacterium]
MTSRQYQDNLETYVNEGMQRAETLSNRGPIRFDANGKLAPDILEAYSRTGFYVFEGLINPDETQLLRDDMASLLDRAPIDNGATVDHKGRPAFGQEFARSVYSLIRPLADPWGGTDKLNGRHPTQMTQPVSDEDTPNKVVFLMGGMCQIMDSGLRLYGHPDLLAIAASINGDDFVPYNDAIFVKQPGLGGSVSWHQDGVTHWDSPDWDEGIHGFNFQVQLYDTSAYSCLWVVPGSHKAGKIDIAKMIDANGSEQLPEGVPLHAKAGDVTIVNRQALHCSFANVSKDQRISLTFGFHRRRSVLGAHGSLSESESVVYDEKRIDDRSQVIGVAIDARSKHYPDETSYNYLPMAGREQELRFNLENWEKIIKDYNLKDLSI